jgi:hypothetical protein
LNSSPFGLAPGITVNSAQAGIVNNVRTVATPAITPIVGTDWPLNAGAAHNMYFSNGQPGSLGFYVVAGVPSGTGIPLGISPWAVLGLSAGQLIVEPFTADVDGNHVFPFTTTPGLSGSSFGLQAVQLHLGATAEWYTTNPWLLTFQ